MNEIDRISNPDNGPPPIGQDWTAQPRLTTSDLWWTSWILAAIATVVKSLMTSAGTVDSVVLWAAVGAGLYAAAGGLLGSVVLTIGGRLSDPSLV
jgi:predicted anti-sigma-YlaC factor YlaD